ncbi:hypothetical protein JCM33374_g4870 [Metschnikowia sp. JCM 33374]|nr:hypothetical protein JCM33374_g4870 [Metschnikowia sp. JCM 33374]
MSDSISYLTVYNAHSGEFTKIPKPVRFPSLQKLKNHLLENFTNNIIASTENIFLLTPFGIKLDFAMVNEMSELYLYDRRLFQNSAEGDLVIRYSNQAQPQPTQTPEPRPFPFLKGPSKPSGHFDASNRQKDLLESFKSYEIWTGTMVQSLRRNNENIDALIRQINVIFKSLNIIFSFASNFVGSAEKSFKSQFNYVKMLAMKSLNKSWKSHFASLQEFPSFRLKDGTITHLHELLDRQSLSHAASYVSEHLPRVVLQFNELSLTINQVNDDKLKVDKFIETHRRDSMNNFENFESGRQAISKDIETIMSEMMLDMMVLDSASTEELEEYYARHTEIGTQLFQKTHQIYSYMESFHSFKVKLAKDCPEAFENIAIQQLNCVEVKNKCKKLLSHSETPENQINNHSGANDNEPNGSDVFSNIKEYEDLLSTTVDLPLLFGFVLIEKRRQFEWHDFYSKGIVANMSDQLTVIIDHEKVFQKLWIKKFGKLIKLINPETGMNVNVPAIDVTLVNSGPSLSENSVLSWLGDCQVEREDIINYISCVKNHRFSNNSRFSELLERNFKDLIASTEKLKTITKTVASLGSHSAAESGMSSKSQLAPKQNIQTVDNDTDLNLIKGLKSRIKKLEDLLHQQQFKNLTGWPVVKSNENKHPDNKLSLLLTNPKREGLAKNPINLLPKTVSSRKSSLDLGIDSSRKVLDASTTIDKHLDNIRLRKEINELRASNSKLSQENRALSSELETSRKNQAEREQKINNMRIQLDDKVTESKAVVAETHLHYENELSTLRKSHDDEVKALKSSLARLECDIEHEKSENSRLKSEIALSQQNLEAESSQTSKDNEVLRDEVSALTAKLSDLQIMNAELLSNMQAKEAEFSTERSDTEKKIKDLEYKLEEKTEYFEDLMEMTQSKSRSMEDLLTSTNISLRALLSAVGELLVSNMKSFHEFCIILESMGLLLVRELNSETNLLEFRIRRVKGLRSKKEVDASRSQLERTKSTAVQEVTKGFDWISHFTEKQKPVVYSRSIADDTIASNEESTHDAEALEAETRQLLQKCETYIMDKGDTGSKLSEFLKMISFEENVQLQSHEDGHDTSKDSFFSNGIIKRFNDVEGFAKKLTKENKAKTTELSKVLKHTNNKISVKDFQEGDLVLFLPTRIERVGEDYETKNTITPWTAFNIDAPHYFLDLSSRKDSISSEEWIVNRIARITKHMVTEENAQNIGENPFSLSVGITWYMITTQ